MNENKRKNTHSVISVFIKLNKTLFVCFVISLIYLVLYVFCLYSIENKPSIEILIDVIFQISIGYIINFIFYITQIYIPQIKLKETANLCIQTNIKGIVEIADEMFLHLLASNKSKNINDYTDKDFLLALQNLNVNGKVNVINPSKLIDPTKISEAEFTVKEWIINNVENINKKIDETLKYYPGFVSPILLEIFNKMKNSSLNKNMVNSLLHIHRIAFSGLQEDVFFMPYYKMIVELKEYLKQHERQ